MGTEFSEKTSLKQRNGLQKWGKNIQDAAYNGVHMVGET